MVLVIRNYTKCCNWKVKLLQIKAKWLKTFHSSIYVDPRHLATSRYLYNTILEKMNSINPCSHRELVDTMSLISPRPMGLHSLPAANTHRCSLFLWHASALGIHLLSTELSSQRISITSSPTRQWVPPHQLSAQLLVNLIFFSWFLTQLTAVFSNVSLVCWFLCKLYCFPLIHHLHCWQSYLLKINSLHIILLFSILQRLPMASGIRASFSTVT